MLHTGKISKCLDVDAKQRQCGTLSQCSRVTKFETVLWVSTKGFSVLCGHLGLPGHFFREMSVVVFMAAAHLDLEKSTI